jgi:predicted PurR-regulated permease PerM
MTPFERKDSIPLYAKLTIILIGFIALFYVLILTSDIVIPLVFAVIIAIVLSPVVDFLVRKKFNRILAIILSILLTLILITGLFTVIVNGNPVYGDGKSKHH